MIQIWNMGKILLFLLLLLGAKGKVYGQFSGNASDGFARANLNGSCPAFAITPFAGGDAAGYASDQSSLLACYVIAPSPFAGGIADGFARVRKDSVACDFIAISPFAGGNSDGYATSKMDSVSCLVIAPTPFAGGIADGFVRARKDSVACDFIAISPFAGGNSDGYGTSKMDSVSCLVIAPTPFAGGIADGFVRARKDSVACDFIAISPFGGGIADGYATSKMDSISCFVVTLTPFAGGKADGFSRLSLIQVNPVTCEIIEPLPIQLLNFDAVPEGDKVRTLWSTATEKNNDYFTVERTLDGTFWIEIGRVKGAGNSTNELNYHLYDYEPALGTQYYRLKQTDYDGEFSYSDARSVTFYRDGNQHISVYPNPSQGIFTMKVSGDPLEEAKISILNLAGQLITSESDFSGQLYKFDLRDHPAGMYFIEIETRTKTERIKLIKVN